MKAASDQSHRSYDKRNSGTTPTALSIIAQVPNPNPVSTGSIYFAGCKWSRAAHGALAKWPQTAFYNRALYSFYFVYRSVIIFSY